MNIPPALHNCRCLKDFSRRRLGRTFVQHCRIVRLCWKHDSRPKWNLCDFDNEFDSFLTFRVLAALCTPSGEAFSGFCSLVFDNTNSSCTQKPTMCSSLWYASKPFLFEWCYKCLFYLSSSSNIVVIRNSPSSIFLSLPVCFTPDKASVSWCARPAQWTIFKSYSKRRSCWRECFRVVFYIVSGPISTS